MVDQEGLVLEPFGPAPGADLILNPRSEVGSERSLRQPWLVGPTTLALDSVHLASRRSVVDARTRATVYFSIREHGITLAPWWGSRGG